MDLSDETLDKLSRCLNDKFWRLNNLYHIKDKQGKEVLFEMNPAQLEYYQSKHNRNLIPKSRQLGFTTLEVLDALDSCLFIPNFDAGIIAHTVDDAEKIFTNKVNFAFDRLPEFIRVARMPNTDRAGEMRFPNGSSISVSAGFRGGTLRKLLVSEFAKICAKFPEKAREIITGALNAVPLDGEATFESTAEGMDGYFFKMVDQFSLMSPDELTPLDFKVHFFPWYKAREYRLNPLGIHVPTHLQDYFKRLEKEHSVKLEDSQKAWYSKKWAEQGDDIHREYPSFLEEAFQASGRPVFNQDQLAADIRKAKEIKYRRGYVLNGEFKEQERGGLCLRLPPISGEAYSIGADIAEGLEHGDHSTAAVYNKEFKQVAVYKGHLDPDMFGDLLVELGTYYNQALLVPEVNNHGHATIAAIKRRNYFNVWRREVTAEELATETVDKIGWITNAKSKMKMLDDFKAAYRDGSLDMFHEETLREMRTATYEEDGNVILNGKDLIVCNGLAIQGLSQATRPGSLGAFESASMKPKFKTLEEMLKWGENNSSEESYFD